MDTNSLNYIFPETCGGKNTGESQRAPKEVGGTLARQWRSSGAALAPYENILFLAPLANFLLIPHETPRASARLAPPLRRLLSPKSIRGWHPATEISVQITSKARKLIKHAAHTRNGP